MVDQTDAQLRLLHHLATVLTSRYVRFWLRGGWAIDFHLGQVTRPHADIDLVVWLRHRRRTRDALTAAGFELVRDRDVQTDLRSQDQDVSIVYLTHASDGQVFTHGLPDWRWATTALPLRRRTLRGVSARVVSPEQLLKEKASYEQGTGRPLRPKDVASMTLLRSITSPPSFS